MNRPTVSVDVDGTMAASHEMVVSYLNTEYREEMEENGVQSFSVEDIQDYYSWGEKFREFGITSSECIDTLLKAWETGAEELIGTTEPVEEMRKKLSYLHDNFYADIVTANRKRDSIKKWLENKGIKKGEHYGELISITNQNIETKGELGYSFYIDDKPSVKQELSPSQGLLLYSRPYNSDVEERFGPLVRRVENFEEAVEILDEARKPKYEMF